jgi:hypothetical protein
LVDWIIGWIGLLVASRWILIFMFFILIARWFVSHFQNRIIVTLYPHFFPKVVIWWFLLEIICFRHGIWDSSFQEFSRNRAQFSSVDFRRWPSKKGLHHIAFTLDFAEEIFVISLQDPLLTGAIQSLLQWSTLNDRAIFEIG